LAVVAAAAAAGGGGGGGCGGHVATAAAALREAKAARGVLVGGDIWRRNNGRCVAVGGIGGEIADGCESEEKTTGALFSAARLLLIRCSSVEAGWWATE